MANAALQFAEATSEAETKASGATKTAGDDLSDKLNTAEKGLITDLADAARDFEKTVAGAWQGLLTAISGADRTKNLDDTNVGNQHREGVIKNQGKYEADLHAQNRDKLQDAAAADPDNVVAAVQAESAANDAQLAADTRDTNNLQATNESEVNVQLATQENAARTPLQQLIDGDKADADTTADAGHTRTTASGHAVSNADKSAVQSSNKEADDLIQAEATYLKEIAEAQANYDLSLIHI